MVSGTIYLPLTKGGSLGLFFAKSGGQVLY